MIRLIGVCNFDPATTVLAHYRMVDVSGMSTKSPDVIGAWACSACHAKVDSDKSADVQIDFLRGILRTQVALTKEGVLKW